MAYKEIELRPGEAKDLYNIWNSGMGQPKKKAAPKKKKEPTKKKASK